jgi:hypothetical protein
VRGIVDRIRRGQNPHEGAGVDDGEAGIEWTSISVAAVGMEFALGMVITGVVVNEFTETRAISGSVTTRCTISDSVTIPATSSVSESTTSAEPSVANSLATVRAVV